MSQRTFSGRRQSLPKPDATGALELAFGRATYLFRHHADRCKLSSDGTMTYTRTVGDVVRVLKVTADSCDPNCPQWQEILAYKAMLADGLKPQPIALQDKHMLLRRLMLGEISTDWLEGGLVNNGWKHQRIQETPQLATVIPNGSDVTFGSPRVKCVELKFDRPVFRGGKQLPHLYYRVNPGQSPDQARIALLKQFNGTDQPTGPCISADIASLDESWPFVSQLDFAPTC